MKKTLILAGLLVISSNSQADTTSAEDFCVGKTPDKDSDPILLRLYEGAPCTSIRNAWIEKASISNSKAIKDAADTKKDQIRENTSEDVDLAKKISDAVKTTNKDLPSLAAFSSTAKRYLSDVAYRSGLSIGATIANKMDINRALIFVDPDAAEAWLNLPSPDPLIRDLVKIETISSNITASLCEIQSKPKTDTEQKTGLLSIGATLTAAKAALDSAAVIANMFQPQVTNSTSIDAPSQLVLSIKSGLQTGYLTSNKAPKASFMSRPPLITQSNRVIVQANKTAFALKDATTHVEDMTKKLKANQQLEPQCSERIAVALADATKLYASKSSKELTPNVGSAIDQGAREVALLDAKVDSFITLGIVTSGGGVTGYQRNRFSSVKLVAGSDLALVVDVIRKSDGHEFSEYLSAGCGQSIPLGEFSEKYQSSSCLR